MGTVIAWLDHPWLRSYEFFFFFSFTVLALNVFLLGALLRDFAKSGNLPLVVCSLIFVCSVAVVYLAALIGRHDHYGLLMTLLAMRMTKFWRKFLFAVPALFVVLLAYEGALILFFPVLFLSLLFSVEEDRKKIQAAALALFSMSALAFVFWLTTPRSTPDQAQDMRKNLQEQVGMPLTEVPFDVLHRSTADNFHKMKETWSYTSERSIQFFNSLFVVAPVLLCCIGMAVFVLHGAGAPRYLAAFTVLAALSPLVMNFFGTDLHRWSALSAVASFLVLHVVWTRYGPPPHGLRRGRFFALACGAIFLVSISNTALLGHQMKDFPFVSHQKYVYHLISGKTCFPCPPSP